MGVIFVESNKYARTRVGEGKNKVHRRSPQLERVLDVLIPPRASSEPHHLPARFGALLRTVPFQRLPFNPFHTYQCPFRHLTCRIGCPSISAFYTDALSCHSFCPSRSPTLTQAATQGLARQNPAKLITCNSTNSDSDSDEIVVKLKKKKDTSFQKILIK